MRLLTTRTAVFFIIAMAVLMSIAPIGHDGQPIEAASDVFTTNSGIWSDPAVWSSGAVPTTGDLVTITRGHTILYDVLSDAVLSGVNIDGILRFSRAVNTRLKSKGNIFVRAGGHLDMGTPHNYIPKNTKAEVIFVLSQSQAGAYQGGPAFKASDIGLWVFPLGRWDSYGAPLLRTWSKLAKDALAKTDQVTVEHDVTSWQVGGTVVITSSAMPGQVSKGPWEEELRTVTGVSSASGSRTTLTLNKPLTYAHSGTGVMRAEVGLLSRNILVTTELAGYSIPDDVLNPDVSQRKFAHTLFMDQSHGTVQYSEFKYMGSFGELARYPIHLHEMVTNGSEFVLRGNGIWMSGNRWVVAHDTNGTLVEDNVGFDTNGSGFFAEKTLDAGRHKQDGILVGNVFSHNLGVRLRFDENAGLPAKHGVFWWDRVDQIFMGNVASGAGIHTKGQGERLAGFVSPSEANRSGKSQPLIFLKNETHSNYGSGIWTWNNSLGINDMVDTLIWRNGKVGILWGAYDAPFRHFQARILENGKWGLNIKSVRGFLQDSEVSGTGKLSSSSEGGIGLHVGFYTEEPLPTTPVHVIRTVFSDNKIVDMDQRVRECREPKYEAIPIVGGHGCASVWVDVWGSSFLSPNTIRYGWSPNKNSYFRFFDYTGGGNLPKNFVMLRKDQDDPANQAPISSKLVTSKSYYSAETNSLVTPMSSLPAGGIDFVDLEHFTCVEKSRCDPPYSFTFRTTPDLPPVVNMAVTTNGTKATMTADVSDDKKVTKVEFYVDEIKVAEKTSGPYSLTVDLAGRERKYAYLYVKAYDDGEFVTDNSTKRDAPPPIPQVSYSKIVEIGPDVSNQGRRNAH